MLKKCKKPIIIISVILLLSLLYQTVNYLLSPSGKITHLDYTNALTIETTVDKWYTSENDNVIKDKKGCEKLQNYINSLELIEVKTDYGRSNSGHLYFLQLPYESVSIQGEYLSVHEYGVDDKVYTEYYIVNSGYNPITQSSKVSREFDDIIREYGE